jgi:AmmeMemoRadiSam system protein A
MPHQAQSPTASGLDALSDPERRELLRLARCAVEAAVGVGPPPELRLDSPSLLEYGAAFVSIYVGGRLRGCVGATARNEPLYATVIHVARGAALRDPRFPSLTADEAPHLRIEISRLSPLRPVRPEEIDVNRHGLCVSHGDARGLLLPQVARRYGWNRSRLLEETCLKAGLPADAWRDSEARLFAFEAEVFQDPATQS